MRCTAFCKCDKHVDGNCPKGTECTYRRRCKQKCISDNLFCATHARFPPAPAPRRQKRELPECSICCCKITNRYMLERLACDHVYHYRCISEWYKTCLRNAYKSDGDLVSCMTCPMCRRQESFYYVCNYMPHVFQKYMDYAQFTEALRTPLP